MVRAPLLFLRRLEIMAAVIGALLALLSWWWMASSQKALAVLIGSCFSSLNLRLLIWSWRPMLDDPPGESQSSHPPAVLDVEGAQGDVAQPSLHTTPAAREEEISDEPAPQAGLKIHHAAAFGRAMFKYMFLLGGLGLCVLGLRLYLIGFAIGLGNIVLAITFSPLLPQPME